MRMIPPSNELDIAEYEYDEDLGEFEAWHLVDLDMILDIQFILLSHSPTGTCDQII
jgi:hypothetical protein